MGPVFHQNRQLWQLRTREHPLMKSDHETRAFLGLTTSQSEKYAAILSIDGSITHCCPPYEAVQKRSGHAPMNGELRDRSDERPAGWVIIQKWLERVRGQTTFGSAPINLRAWFSL